MSRPNPGAANGTDRPGSKRAAAPTTSGENPKPRSDGSDERLDDLPDGSGCIEIWEHLSERRAAAADDVP